MDCSSGNSDSFSDGPDDAAESPEPAQHRESEPEPTPAESLFYALVQRHRLFRHGILNQRPADFDIWDVAGTMGVQGDVEFVSEDRRGSHWYFADQVLHFSSAAAVPWRLLTTWEWAAECEVNAFLYEDEVE